MKRLAAIDSARGLAILLMLINHAAWGIPELDFRANYGWNTPPPNAVQEPQGWINLLQGTPVFMLLTGISVALFEAGRRKSGWSEPQITGYFLRRGVLIIALDLLIIPWAIRANYLIYESKFFVLMCIALCLWALAFLRYLPVPRLLTIAAALTISCQIVYHLVSPADSNLLRSLTLYPSPADEIAVGYPALAWLPVICLGYASGRYAIQRPELFRRFCLMLGAAGLLLWSAVIIGDGFGRLYHGHALILTKHPPELAYLAFNVGAAYIVLAGLQTLPAPRLLVVLGRNALAFYVGHWYVLMAVTALAGQWLGSWALYVVVVSASLLILY